MSDAIDPSIDELRRRARRRLVGAIVLALAAAVLVPMLLESEPKPLGEDVSVKIPPVDEGKFVSKIDKSRAGEAAPASAKSAAPAPAPSSDAGTAAAAKQASAVPSVRKPPDAAAASSKSKETAGTSKDEPSSEAANPTPAIAATPPKPAAEPATQSAEAAKSVKPGSAFSVQLAAFADDKGANALSSRLKKSGHPAYTEAYETSKGTLWRVRVGPYATRDAAEAARAKLKADGQSGIIAASN